MQVSKERINECHHILKGPTALRKEYDPTFRERHPAGYSGGLGDQATYHDRTDPDLNPGSTT